MATTTFHRDDLATAGISRVRSARPDPNGREDEAMEVEAILPSPPQSRHEREPRPWDNPPPQSTVLPAEKTAEVAPMIRLTRKQAPARRFEILQQWEGVVSEITDESIWAELRDLTRQSPAIEVVELPLEEIPRADRPLLRIGGVFYWSIGYETSPGGQIRRVSEIRVRRTPQWSRHSVDSIRAKAKDLLQRLVAHDENHTPAC